MPYLFPDVSPELGTCYCIGAPSLSVEQGTAKWVDAKDLPIKVREAFVSGEFADVEVRPGYFRRKRPLWSVWVDEDGNITSKSYLYA